MSDPTAAEIEIIRALRSIDKRLSATASDIRDIRFVAMIVGVIYIIGFFIAIIAVFFAVG